VTVRLAIVAASFNEEITDRMVKRAVARAKELGATVEVVRVPGTFEIPLALRRLLARRDVDAGVALGALIQGETDHDDLLGHSVATALLDLQIRTGKPIGLGITGPGMSHKVAMRRIGNAARAVDAAIAMARASARPRGRRPRR
jgi:6,7-dimethyl-8-ribityllumazine synthase